MCLFSPVYLGIHSFISLSVIPRYWRLCTLGPNPMSSMLLFRCSSFGQQALLQGGPCVPVTTHPFTLWTLPYFLVLQDAPGSSQIFADPALESAVSPRSPGPFIGDGIRNQDLVIRCATCYGCYSLSAYWADGVRECIDSQECPTCGSQAACSPGWLWMWPNTRT